MTELDPQLKTDIATAGYRNSLISFGNFTLRSGLWSPWYMDIRVVPSISVNPDRTDMTRADQLKFRMDVVNAYSGLLEFVEPHDHIQSIPEAVDHLIGMIGFAADESVLKRRVKQKEHGSASDGILGHYNDGDVTVLVDDLITTSGAKVDEKNLIEDISKRDLYGQPTKEGLVVKNAVVLLDRGQGGIETARKSGLIVVAALTDTEFIEIPHAEGIMDDRAYEVIQGYREGAIKGPEDISSTWVNFEPMVPHSPKQVFG